MAKIGNLEIEEKVFERTRELLLNYGVKGWNMDDLSNKCGMAKRTLYKIIGNKEALIYKCVLDYANLNVTEIRRFTNSSQSYNILLDKFSETVTNIFEEYIIKNAASLIKEYPKIEKLIDNTRILLKENYTNFFRKGVELGYLVEFVTPESIHDILKGIIEYNIFNCKSKEEFEEKMIIALKVFIRGIRK